MRWPARSASTVSIRTSIGAVGIGTGATAGIAVLCGETADVVAIFGRDFALAGASLCPETADAERVCWRETAVVAAALLLDPAVVDCPRALTERLGGAIAAVLARGERAFGLPSAAFGPLAAPRLEDLRKAVFLI